jgi:hypothetical protein
VVQPHASPQDDGKTFYKIGFADKVGVRSYAPLLPDPPVFEKNQAFRHWFMTKRTPGQHCFHALCTLGLMFPSSSFDA